MYIRTKKWMKKNYSIPSRGCVYPIGYCKYWKNCVEGENIHWFKSQTLKALRKIYSDKKDLETQKVKGTSQETNRNSLDKYYK